MPNEDDRLLTEIGNIIFQKFYGNYPFPKDWGNESKVCINLAETIINKIDAEHQQEIREIFEELDKHTYGGLCHIHIKEYKNIKARYI